MWFLRYGAQRTEFFVILDHFLPFYPCNNLKNQNVEKMKKTPVDVIVLSLCTTNDKIWCMIAQQTEFFVISGHFMPFYPNNNPKNQQFGKMKQLPADIIILHKCTKNPKNQHFGKMKQLPADIIILHKCTKNHDHMLYSS